MKHIIRRIGLLTIVALMMGSCQDPIFWTQVVEGRTPQNNLNKSARIFDVDTDGSYLYALAGGILYRRAIDSSDWQRHNLPQWAHSIDVDGGQISFTQGIYKYDFSTMTLGAVIDASAERAFFDKTVSPVLTITYGRDQSTNNPMDVFFLNGNRYVGRYVGVIGTTYVISTTGVFTVGSTGTAVNPEQFRDPRGTDGTWLVANTRVGEISGAAFGSILAEGVTGASVTSNVAGFNTTATDGSPPTIALVGVVVGGYREIFQDTDGRYLSRNPITSVADGSVYLASDLNTTYIDRFFYKNGILFALTTDRGLWTQSGKSGIWIWE